MNDILEDVLKNITMSRMLCQMSGEKMASFTEVVAYMMPRTYESPMPYEWMNIYAWVGLQYAKQFKGEEQVKYIEDEIAPKALSDYEMSLLNNLRKWIYEKRHKALKESMKNDKKIELEEAPITKQKELFSN